MSRKLMSLMFAGVVVSSTNVQAVDYTVFPVVGALTYRSIRAVSDDIHYQSMKDVLTATLYFQIDGSSPQTDVSISDLAQLPANQANEDKRVTGE